MIIFKYWENTLTEIAAQKAGIIKESSNTVIFENNKEVDEVFINACKEKNNKLSIIREKDIKNYRYDKDYQYFDYKNHKKYCCKFKRNLPSTQWCNLY